MRPICLLVDESVPPVLGPVGIVAIIGMRIWFRPAEVLRHIVVSRQRVPHFFLFLSGEQFADGEHGNQLALMHDGDRG